MMSNNSVIWTAIFILCLSSMNFAEPTPMIKKLKITTPDTSQFEVQIIAKGGAENLISSNDFVSVDIANPVHNGYKLYTTKNKRQYLLLKKDGSALYFLSSEDFETYLSGETYWSTSIFIENESCYISFSLKPDKVLRFKLKTLQKLEKYKPFDGYKAFLLTTGEVLFIRERVNDLYDGYWYPSLKDFEFSYHSFAY